MAASPSPAGGGGAPREGAPIPPGRPGPRLVGLPPPWWPPVAPAVAALRRRYVPRSLRPHGTAPVLGQADALRFLDDCERLGLWVLGMDFMGRQEPGIPSICDTVDFTSAWGPYDLSDSVARSRAIIARGLPADADGVEFVVHDPTAPPPPPPPRRVVVRFVGGREDGRRISVECARGAPGADGAERAETPPPVLTTAAPFTPEPHLLERYVRDPHWRDHADRGEPIPYHFDDTPDPTVRPA